MGERIVLDPGHGGGAPNGGSTPLGTRGPGGTVEADLALLLATLVRDALAARDLGARLTREGGQNPSLRERIAAARAANAEAFVSLHLNDSPDARARGPEVWAHDYADPRSQGLARAVSRALGAGPVRAGRLGVLDPAWHAPNTATCLAEIDYLTNPDEERRLLDPAHRLGIAEAIASAVADFVGAARLSTPTTIESESESFDVWHQVPLVPQLTGMSCWAAAAAMLVGWRDCLDVRPEEVALGAGAWEEYRDGLEPSSVEALARAFGLEVETPRWYDLAAVRRMLECFGPLWVGAGPTGLHVVVVSGIYGDGTADGTFVRVLDPWPLGRGDRYMISFRELVTSLEAATEAAGVRASILHCGKGARGNRGRGPAIARAGGANAALVRRPPAAPLLGTPLALFNLYRNNPPPRFADCVPEGDEPVSDVSDGREATDR